MVPSHRISETPRRLSCLLIKVPGYLANFSVRHGHGSRKNSRAADAYTARLTRPGTVFLPLGLQRPQTELLCPPLSPVAGATCFPETRTASSTGLRRFRRAHT